MALPCFAQDDRYGGQRNDNLQFKGLPYYGGILFFVDSTTRLHENHTAAWIFVVQSERGDFPVISEIRGQNSNFFGQHRNFHKFNRLHPSNMLFFLKSS